MEGATNNWFSNKYSIGYALSGGFIKGFAHLGAMQALLEHDIKPNIISGVSAGALAGVFYKIKSRGGSLRKKAGKKK